MVSDNTFSDLFTVWVSQPDDALVKSKNAS